MRACSVLAIAVAAAGLAIACGNHTAGSSTSAASRPGTLIVLGIDGMDPELVQRYMSEGRTPNLAALAERGTFLPLGTTNPPQSPVAWSTFITGSGPHDHGIYDFVHRDPNALAPYLSTSRTEPGDTIKIGPLTLPASSASVELLRGGIAIWELLSRGDVMSVFVKIPANFPPSGARRARVLAGMGTPDLLGTYGTFHVYTDSPDLVGQTPSGGQVHELVFDQQRARSSLPGPPDPLSSKGDPLELAVEVVRDRDREVALVRIGLAEILVMPGEWSHWVPIAYNPGLLAGDIHGMVRVYLKSLRPHLTLYVSPVNMDPLAPAMPLSAPEHYASQLAEQAGRYYTQGMPADTKAFAAGILSEDEFLAQVDLVFEERVRMLNAELDRFDSGLLFMYFSSIDLVSHVFWRTLAADAGPDDRRYAHVIPDLYQRIDGVIGDVVKRAGPETPVIIMSDHGFAPYLRKVHVNTWLAERGYLAVRQPGVKKLDGPQGHIDWSRTQAYALGLNEIFINLRGRERYGAVSPRDKAALVNRLVRELEQFRDPETGQRVVTQVHQPESGSYPHRTPDLIVGFARGYRSSDESAIGAVGELVLEDNLDRWSGDHCMDASHVPGVLFSSEPLPLAQNSSGDSSGAPSLIDFAPALLAYFGIEKAQHLQGRPFIARGSKR